MSGSGGSGGDWRPAPQPIKKDGGGGPDGTPPDPCNIVEITNLNSVNAAILAGVRIGDVLLVVFQPGPPSRLVAQDTKGQVVGSITSASMLQIIQCITQGSTTYEASVLAIRGGICQIEIHPR